MEISLVPLGDQAILSYFADEAAALCFAESVRRSRDAWLVDVVSSYSSVAVFFDLNKTGFGPVAERLQEIGSQPAKVEDIPPARLHHIPCCYELELDLARVAEWTRLPAEEIIRLHAATEYTVYAIGFCPGFPYLGYLPPELCGVPRLDTPRLHLAAGSVGLTGRQTGIYTEARPGGWNIIGQTPLELVNVALDYFPLHPGDRVRFEPIDRAEFERLQGRRIMVRA